jgi:subtilase family serine protease
MAGNNVVMFSGTSDQISDAFHTEIHIYKVQGESYTANASNPQIPAAFSDVISSFSPNNFPVHAQHTTPKIIQRTDKGWKAVPGLKSQINYNIGGQWCPAKIGLLAVTSTYYMG